MNSRLQGASPTGASPKRVPEGRSSPMSFTSPKRDVSFLSSTRLTPTRNTPRYSVAEITSPRMQRSKEQMYRNGPLLASTRFNVSLGMYTDAKSPGLTTRLVQYNNEQKKSVPTHQWKYGSPGLFPVVHFFKKELPTMPQRHNRVTVKLASPDPIMYSNGTVGNGIDEIQTTPRREASDQDTGTRSVLDALKEISRKRINGAEEMSAESSKHSKHPLNEFSKRRREESPTPMDTSPQFQAAKRMCIIDPVYASNTSSLFCLLEKAKGKRKAENANVVQVRSPEPEKKQVKLTNSETQTTVIEIEEELTTVKEPPVKVAQPVVVPEKEPERSTDNILPMPPVFNEKLHQIQKKNKLASILGAISGEVPVLVPIKPQEICDHKLVSILSPQNKVKHHSKHVHFDLDAESSSAGNVAMGDPPESIASVTSGTEEMNKEIPTTETNSATPVPEVLSSPSNVPQNSVSKGGFQYELSPPRSKLASLLETPTSSTQPRTSAEGQYSFGERRSTEPSVSSTSPSTTCTEPFKIGAASVTEAASPFKFGASTVPSTVTLAPFELKTFTQDTHSVNSAPFDAMKSTSNGSGKTSLGGQMFPAAPLSRTGSASTITVPSNNAFGLITSTVSSVPTMFNSPTNSDKSALPGSPTSTFGSESFMKGGFSAPMFSTATSAAMFGSGTSTSPSFTAPVSSSSVFGTGSPKVTSSAFGPSAGFGPTPTTASNGATDKATPAFTTNKTGGFGVGTSNPLFNASSAPSVVSFAFGAPPTTSSPSFGTTTSSAMPFGALGVTATGFVGSTTPPPTFGSTKMSTPTFGTPTKSTPSFGAPTTAPPTFGASTTAVPAFGTTTTAGAGFGSTATSVTAFGATTTSPFGAATTSIPTFGTTTVPAFGASTTSVPAFGAHTNTFGATTTTALSFGTSTTPALSFGTSTTPAPTFGTSTTPAPTFGTSITPVASFGASTTPAPSFGATTTPAQSFGATTTPAPSFGTTTTPAPTFGATTAPTPAFGACSTTLGFGGPATSQNVFGSTAGSVPAFSAQTKPAPAFGAPVASAQGFGATTTLVPSFGTSATSTGTFGTPTTSPPAFGATSTSTPAFGVTKAAAPTFGGQTAFGGPTAAAPNFGPPNMFGPSTTITTTFGAPVTTASTYGSPTVSTGFGTSGFGSTTTFGAPATTASSIFSFGEKAAATTASPFGFNSSGNVSTFGASSTPAFGGNVAPGFGVATTNSFGATTKQSFITATTTAQSTFGAGSQQPPSFGSTPAPSFGAKTTPGPYGTGTPPPFGPAGSAPLYGPSQSTSAFRTTNSNNTFGSPTPAFTANSFGSSTFDFKPQSNNTFGAGSNASGPFNAAPAQPNFNSFNAGADANQTPQASIFSFGGPAPAAPALPPKPGVFSFGAPEPPKSGGYNFSGGAPVPNFSGSVPNFNTPNWNGVQAPPYNAQFNAPSAGMFNIGAGSSVKRNQLRAKRRN